MHGFQLWVNLPAADKMMRPRYQEIPRSQIPIGTADNGRITARVLAGEALGVSAVIDTRTPILYVHYTLAPEARVHTEIPPEYEVFAYVFSGGGTFGPKATPAEAGEMVHFERDGAGVSLASGSKERLDLLLIGGQPLGEPVVQYGPFVMNTEAQIMQAIHDYQTGQFTT